VIYKNTDSRSKGFGEISVELDAIAPHVLRALVEAVIEEHLPAEQYQVLKERQLIGGLVAMAKRALNGEGDVR
jgi:hypothetical protein